MLETLLHAAVTGTAGTLAVAGLLTAFGTRRAPPPLSAVNGAFSHTDWSALGPLPELQHLTARDGTRLAWRSWPCASPQRSAILVHGSTADSRSL
ncbi:MAG TPA: hypothetical protein VFH49_12000, partial [Aquabacterium sp.]|nr:hypothetical protein [Aquabacterium sp.]